MSIEAEIRVTIAEVEVTDGYEVQLRTLRRRTVLTPDEAAKLADELYEVAGEAARLGRVDRLAVFGVDTAGGGS